MELNAADLRRHAAWGLVAGIISALGVKAVTLAGQVLAAHFLTPADYGLVAPALSLGSLAGLFAVSAWGVMILRSPADNNVRSAIFHAGTMLSVVPLLLLGAWWAAGPTTHWQPVALAFLVCCPVILSPVSTLYATTLQTRLKLRRLATLQFAEGVIATFTLVVLAALGAGAYAIASFKSIGALVIVWFYRAAAGPIALDRIDWTTIGRVSRKGILVSAYLALAGLVMTLPAAIVAMGKQVEVAGILAWSLQFAVQLPVVLGFAARQVQMSVTSNQRLTGADAETRGGVPLLATGLVVAVLQAVTAPLLIPLVFPERWGAATLAVQMLSIAQVLLPLITVQAGVALVADRLWHVAVGTALALAISSGTALWCAWKGQGDATTIALVVSLGFLLAHFTNWIVVEALGRSLSWPAVARPFGVTVIGIAICAALSVSEMHPRFAWLVTGSMLVTLAVAAAVSSVAWAHHVRPAREA